MIGSEDFISVSYKTEEDLADDLKKRIKNGYSLKEVVRPQDVIIAVYSITSNQSSEFMIKDRLITMQNRCSYHSDCKYNGDCDTCFNIVRNYEV